MSEESVLAATVRTETGSGAVNRLRKQGALPGVVYGLADPKNVQVDAAAFSAIQRHHSSENVMLKLEVEGDQAHNVLVRDVQHHPLSGVPMHVDFYELSMTKRVTVDIPVELIGTPIGVTRDGGLMEQMLREVEIDCLPGDIPEQIELDVSKLEVGDGLNVGDIPLDSEKYEVVTASDIAIVLVAAARVEDAGADADEETAAAAGEPEVIGEAASDEEGSEEKSE